MNTLSFKTQSANRATASKKWVVIDANEAILGRLATGAAFLLRGKHKTDFTPHVDCGDNVIVINAEKVQLTGNKWSDKEYISHTGYPGGQRTITAEKLMAKNQIALVEKAVKGMLPKSILGRQLYRNLFVYAGEVHPHQAQQPENISLNSIK